MLFKPHKTLCFHLCFLTYFFLLLFIVSYIPMFPSGITFLLPKIVSFSEDALVENTLNFLKSENVYFALLQNSFAGNPILN